jgi:hypothetical protein
MDGPTKKIPCHGWTSRPARHPQPRSVSLNGAPQADALEAISVSRPISRHFRSGLRWIGDLSRTNRFRPHVPPAAPVDGDRPVKGDRRKRLPQFFVLSLALQISRCRRFGCVDDIDSPAPHERGGVIDAIECFPEDASEAGDQLEHQSSRRSNGTETPRRSRQWAV